MAKKKVKQLAAQQNSFMDRFWDVSTNWWFFPALYIGLCVLIWIQTLVFPGEPYGGFIDRGGLLFFIAIYFWSAFPSLVDFFLVFADGPELINAASASFVLFIATCYGILDVINQKKTRNVIRKKVILAITLYFLLNFASCTAHLWYDPMTLIE